MSSEVDVWLCLPIPVPKDEKVIDGIGNKVFSP